MQRDTDAGLIQIVDAALAEATRRSGEWIACKPGCCECCQGVFAIDALDARRLREGWQRLKQIEPERAGRVLERARAAIAAWGEAYPGDPQSGSLGEDDESQARFDDFAVDEPCAALHPETGLCDLYEARPMTCRVFGPAVRHGDGSVRACELCYVGASDAEIAACAVEIEAGPTEAALAARLERETGERGMTVVAWAIARAAAESGDCG